MLQRLYEDYLVTKLQQRSGSRTAADSGAGRGRIGGPAGVPAIGRGRGRAARGRSGRGRLADRWVNLLSQYGN